MSDASPRFQSTVRQLLEILFWISAGMASFKMAWVEGDWMQLRPRTFEFLESVLFLTLMFSPGAALGAAVGVIVHNRGSMALLGFILWIVGLLSYPLWAVHVSR